MLAYKEHQDISFEAMLENALNQIPLYTAEWTDFHISDPGITILENLTAFNMLHQTYLSRLDDAVKLKLFELAGIKAEPVNCAKVLLAADCGQKVVCCSNQKFMVEDICFENNRSVTLGCGRVTDVFVQKGETVTDMTHLLDETIPTAEYIWGDNPAAGSKLYIILDRLPENTDIFIMYADICQEFQRNPFTDRGRNPFAHIRWQMYTKDGYKDIKVKDDTECFLQSGMLRFKLFREKAALYEHYGCHGYAIRGILESADYDAPPKAERLSAFLFEAWQKDSKGLCYTFPWNIPWNKEERCEEDSFIEVYCGMMEEGYICVFVMEEDRKYHKYTEALLQEERCENAGGRNIRGRYYRKERIERGQYRIFFSKEKYGYGPRSAANAVRLVIYDEEVMRRYHVGKVYGYRDQQFELFIKNVLADSFSLIVKTEGKNGDEYEFVKPDSKKEGALRYYLDSEEGIVHIMNAGKYAGAELFLGGLAVTGGAAGNVEPGRVFSPVGLDGKMRITNPARGQGGCDRDSLDSLKKKFASVVSQSLAAVSAEDYERIVMNTPGLCIGKVKAVMAGEENAVEISIVPAMKELSPRAETIYRERIREYIEHFRLLSTAVRIKKAERAAVDVDIVVRTKSHYSGCEDIIAGRIRDYIVSSRRFGEVLKYEDIYRLVSGIECVQGILELSLTSQNAYLAAESRMSVKPEKTCLLYPGNITVKVQTSGECPIP